MFLKSSKLVIFDQEKGRVYFVNAKRRAEKIRKLSHNSKSLFLSTLPNGKTIREKTIRGEYKGGKGKRVKEKGFNEIKTEGFRKELGSFLHTQNSVQVKKRKLLHLPETQKVEKSFFQEAELITTPDARMVFEYWNSKGKPFTVHKTGTNSEVKILKTVELTLKRYSAAKMFEAIDICYQSLTSPNTRLNPNSFPFKNLTLRTFCQFNDRQRELLMQKPKYVTIHALVDEFAKGWAYVIEHYGKFTKDLYPAVTKKYRGLWEIRVLTPGAKLVSLNGNQITPLDENNFRRASKKLVRFIEKHKKQLRVTGREISFPAQFVYHAYDCLESQNLPKIHTGFLRQKFFFDDHLPRFLINQGLMVEKRRRG